MLEEIQALRNELESVLRQLREKRSMDKLIEAYACHSLGPSFCSFIELNTPLEELLQIPMEQILYGQTFLCYKS